MLYSLKSIDLLSWNTYTTFIHTFKHDIIMYINIVTILSIELLIKELKYCNHFLLNDYKIIYFYFVPSSLIESATCST